MPPIISPTNTGALSYSISDSRAFVVAFSLTTEQDDEREITIVHPEPLASLNAVLHHVDSGIDVELHNLDAGEVIDIDIDNDGRRRITVAGQGTTQMVATIHNLTGDQAGIGEPWQLRVSADSPQGWTFAVDNVQLVNVTRLVCDPNAAFSTFPPQTVVESTQNVQMAAIDPLLGTVVGAAPSVVYQWGHDAAAVIDIMPTCGDTAADASRSITIPTVYGELSAPIVLTVGFDTTCANLPTAFLQRSATAPMTIQPRPQQIALVLDRSGSMALENRWVNAEIAGRMLVNLFHAIRSGTHPQDRIGIVVFEDPTCTWHAPPSTLPPDAILLSPSTLDDAAAAICALPMGAPGACTNLGDGLIAAMDMLAVPVPDPDPDPEPDPKYTMMVVTDGFENAGPVQVGPATPLPPGVVSFATAREATPERKAVSDALTIHTIGLGTTVDSAVLNNLAGAGGFVQVTEAADLAVAFGVMLSMSQNVAHRPASPTPLPANGADPSPPPPNPSMPPDKQPNAVYFGTAASADKLAVAVLAASGTIELSWRTGPGAFTAAGNSAVITECNGHIIGAVGNVPGISTGEIEWKVVHKIGTAAQNLLARNVLAYEDLHVKAELRLDRKSYGTGDKMRLTVHIRHDNKVVLGARVRAALDAPEVGLGTALSEIGPGFTAERRKGDAPTGRGALIEETLKRKGWKHWPRGHRSKGLFIDNTDELHDRDGDGNYTNTFARTFEDGVYTWDISVDGTDTLGNHFAQQILLSTVVTVKVDARATKVTVSRINNHPSGRRAARIVIVPQDVRGKLLGPGFDNVVVWGLDDGTFEHVFNQEPEPVFTDGSYQRVVLYRQNQRPRLTVFADGVVLPRISVTGQGGHGHDDDDDKGHDHKRGS